MDSNIPNHFKQFQKQSRNTFMNIIVFENLELGNLEISKFGENVGSPKLKIVFGGSKTSGRNDRLKNGNNMMEYQ